MTLGQGSVVSTRISGAYDYCEGDREHQGERLEIVVVTIAGVPPNFKKNAFASRLPTPSSTSLVSASTLGRYKTEKEICSPASDPR